MECIYCGSTNVIKLIGRTFRCLDCRSKFTEDEAEEEEQFDPTNDEGDNSDQLEDDAGFF